MTGRLFPWFLLFTLLCRAPAFASSVLPAGIADEAGRTAFLANADGGIDAIDLATGDRLWETDQAQTPLVVVGDRLFGQLRLKANRVRVVAFDLLDRGKIVLASDPIDFPDWVDVRSDAGHEFRGRWGVDRAGLVLAWQARTRPQPGLADPGSRREESGRVLVDTRTGSIKHLPVEPSADEPTPPKELTRLVVRWQAAVGSRYLALTVDSAERQQTLWLRSWELATGKAAQPKELARGSRLTIQPTADGRHVAVLDALPPPDQQTGEEGSRKASWAVYSLMTGEAVGWVPFEPGVREASVIGSRLFYATGGTIVDSIRKPYQQPRTLKAVDLKTGKRIWERPIAPREMTPPGR